MKLKPYPKYKDSGIQWIGEIPEGWGKNKIKHFSNMITGTTPDSGNDRYWEGDIIWVTPADLSQREKYIYDSKRKITKEGYNSCGTIYVNKDGIILATRAPIGYATIVGIKLCFNQGCKAFEILKAFYPDYVYYFLNSFEEALISKGNATTFGELSMYDLSSFEVLKPKYEDQQKSASFLDSKTSEIDKTISADKKLIELLKEKRTAMINHVVTKGLNPKAKMKDSGIDWIGEIPEGWEVHKLKFKEIVIMGQSPDSEEYNYESKGDPFLQGNAEFSELYPTPSIWCDSCGKLALKGDILLSVRAPIGALNIADQKYGIGRGLCAIRVRQINRTYLFYQLSILTNYLNSIGSGSTYLAISIDDIANLLIRYPPKSKQSQIAQYLDKATSKIDSTIQKIEKKLELLEEFKKSIIHYVVTGKVDVRGVKYESR